MSREFTIDKCYYEDSEQIYKKSKMVFEPGLTVLIGCNGSGKTTLLRHMKRVLENESIPVLMFDNLHDGGSNARSEAAYHENFEFVATSMCSSEGENIVLNLENLARKIGSLLRSNTAADELWILLDAVDSGLSIDNIIDLKEFINMVLEGAKNKDVYFIASANEYELARGEKCFCVTDGKYVNVKSYDRYRSIILKTREFKNKRYGDETK